MMELDESFMDLKIDSEGVGWNIPMLFWSLNFPGVKQIWNNPYLHYLSRETAPLWTAEAKNQAEGLSDLTGVISMFIMLSQGFSAMLNHWLVVWIFFHIFGIITPTDFHIFQKGSNHQPDHVKPEISPCSPHVPHVLTLPRAPRWMVRSRAWVKPPSSARTMPRRRPTEGPTNGGAWIRAPGLKKRWVPGGLEHGDDISWDIYIYIWLCINTYKYQF